MLKSLEKCRLTENCLSMNGLQTATISVQNSENLRQNAYEKHRNLYQNMKILEKIGFYDI